MPRTHYRGLAWAIRIWTAPESPLPGHLTEPGAIAVEWRGQAGHPSSYGLLGGWLRGPADTSSPTIPNGVYREALAVPADVVRFGLNQRGDRTAVTAASPELIVALAAEAQAGSSQFVFFALGQLLTVFLHHGVPDSEGDVWRLCDEAFQAARRWSASLRSASI